MRTAIPPVWNARAVSREADQIGSGATSDFEHAAAAVAAKGNQASQMMELLEMVLLEVGEKSRRAGRMPRDLEIVDVRFPVLAHRALGGWRRRSGHGRLL